MGPGSPLHREPNIFGALEEDIEHISQGSLSQNEEGSCALKSLSLAIVVVVVCVTGASNVSLVNLPPYLREHNHFFNRVLMMFSAVAR